MDDIKLKPLNILLADDDMDDCTFFKQAIADLGLPANFTTVHDGEELMAYLTENIDHLPHVVFLDLNMPRKNGEECLSEMRKNEKLNNLPVIIFSTTNDWDTINRLFKSGAHVYIHKPSDFAHLKQVIHHALPLAAEKIFSNSPLKYILNAENNDNRPRKI